MQNQSQQIINKNSESTTSLQTRASFNQQKQLLEIFMRNNRRKKELQEKIAKLKPKMTQKKLAQQLENDPRASGIQIILDSDEEDQFDDIDLDEKQIKQDYNKKKAIIDELEYKNKAGVVQRGYVRQFCERDLYDNPKLKQALQKRYKIKGYFKLQQINKFGVLTQIETNKDLIKFISVGVPQRFYDSIILNYNATSISSNNVNKLIIVENTFAHLYDLQTKQYILKTHIHQSQIVYTAFPQTQIESILTITKQGVARLFDIKNKQFYWMCMINTSANSYFCKSDKIIYSVGYQLHSISLKTKEMTIIGSTNELIQQVKEMFIRGNKTFYNVLQTGQFQTVQGLNYIALDSNVEYFPGDCVMVNKKSTKITITNPQIIGKFKIKQDEVCILASQDGQLQQFSLLYNIPDQKNKNKNENQNNNEKEN